MSSVNNLPANKSEQDYLDLVDKILKDGCHRNIRGSYTYSLFGQMIRYPINQIDDCYIFPMATYRKVGLKNIVEELLFILRGDTDTRKLEKIGVPIWCGNTSKDFLERRKLDNIIEEGFMGPMYGFQLRHFGAKFNKFNEEETSRIKENREGFDQLAAIVERIRKKKHNRNLIMTTFNPAQAEYGCLFPCTGIVIHFYVDADDRLSCLMYQRSADILIGVPHNVSFYSLLTILVAKICNLKTHEFVIVLGDAHVYDEHISQYNQCSKQVFPFPKIKIKKDIKEIEDICALSLIDFDLIDYQSGPSVKYNMFVG